ncbi:ArdC family protein [Rhodopseudomonas pseudopalustris]|uniref:Antirestriction protein ArdC n=1 Tax=Rhodopseudomonas pseudopalustris TaxID=1513892 RepID=A0A1H8SPW1_9BRAD|nr:zincin-like metallopeptidase domain-containing protein [Rhodopseudomonas pseudopalustris]SEO80681.1 Antirestriction protein ArdC [Rhodopseudomonas pseudopalustris]
MRKDLYQSITDQIVEQLEQGVRPWLKPWSAAHLAGRVSLPLRYNGTPYRGVNIIALWMQGIAKGYSAPRWMTFKQALELGGCVRKGEKGSLTVYADTITRTETDAASGEETPTEIHFLKGYTVFNVEQIDGLPDQYYDRPALRLEPLPRIARADAFFAATRAEIVHGGSNACYIERHDHIHMPCIDAFESAESYYATLAHECTHWTKHPSRLAREFGRKRWGDEGYAMEELVAELGAAFLCAGLELTPELREDHASYLAHWLTVLKSDRRAIFTAAAHAQRAADFLHGLQPQQAQAEAA